MAVANDLRLGVVVCSSVLEQTPEDLARMDRLRRAGDATRRELAFLLTPGALARLDEAQAAFEDEVLGF